MNRFTTLLAALSFGALTLPAHADVWTLDADLSNLTFGSIKNDEVGESHKFTGLSGTVTADGEIEVLVDLSSVETLIDIRNERMIEHVFKNVGSAKITATVDLTDFDDLDVGQTTTMEVLGTLSLLGTETELYGDFFVMRVSPTQTLISSDGLVMLNMEDAGLNAGIDILQELAGLDSITRVSPVTMRFVFENSGNTEG